jgi:uncharacterized protein YktA (UPF0223 family)
MKTDTFKEIVIGSTRFAGGYYYHKVTTDKSILDKYNVYLNIVNQERESKMLEILLSHQVK